MAIAPSKKRAKEAKKKQEQFQSKVTIEKGLPMMHLTKEEMAEVDEQAKLTRGWPSWYTERAGCLQSGMTEGSRRNRPSELLMKGK